MNGRGIGFGGCWLVAALGACGRGDAGGAGNPDAGPTTATGGGTMSGSMSGGADGTIPPGAGGAGTGVGGTAGSACARLPPITRRLWRLTSEQFANATRDLFGLATAQAFVPSTDDGSSTRFLVNGPELQVNGGFLANGLYPTARNIVKGMSTRISGTCTGGPCLVTCTPTETQRACATRFARELGAKAFRRPLDPTEVTDLLNVFSTVCPAASATCASEAEFNTAIGLMTRAVILAPSFLYRSELGPSPPVADAAGNYPDTTLTPYEVATQLGFTFLGSAPDDGLAAAASNGSLGTIAGITTEVNRLLALPAVRANLTRVVTRWFDLGLLDAQTKSAALLSPLPPGDQDQAAIMVELRTSAEAFVDDVMWTSPGGRITDLVTSPKVFVNQRLALLYGLPFTAATASTFAATTWPASQQRIGMLTHPAFLWAISQPGSTAIVQRGTIIHNDVACQGALPPRVDLTSAEAQAVLAAGDSEITRSDARLASGKLCADGCHAQIDPYGRILQSFDPVGNARVVDEAGRAVVAMGQFTAPSALAPMTISGTAAFADALLSSKALTGCAVQKMVAYAIGSVPGAANTCELDDLRSQLEQSDGTAASLFRRIALGTFMRARSGGSR